MDASYKLIISIVPRGEVNILIDSERQSGGLGGTVMLGMGTAKSTFLEILGLSNSAKEVFYTVAHAEKTAEIMNALIDSCSKKRRPFGILFTVDVLSFIKSIEMSRARNAKNEGEEMEKKDDNEATYELITIIVNRGHADDVMSKARSAGATGGTVINARGTAKPGESKFFGMDIVPEKDMILILSTREKAHEILNAIETLDVFKQKGSGIAFTLSAENFTLLGK